MVWIEIKLHLPSYIFNLVASTQTNWIVNYMWSFVLIRFYGFDLAPFIFFGEEDVIFLILDKVK